METTTASAPTSFLSKTRKTDPDLTPEEWSHVQDIELRIQKDAFQRRLRLKEFFKDFDPLRKRYVTRTQFERILDDATLRLAPQEVDLLARAYLNAQTGDVRYGDFLDKIEKVFRLPCIEKTPLVEVCPPGGTLPPRFETKKLEQDAEERETDALIDRMALMQKTRGVVFKYYYQNFDKLRSGFVTENRFKRSFPFPFTPREIQLLADRFVNDKGDVNYMAIHDAITDPKSFIAEDPPPALSLLHMREDERMWNQQKLTPEEKLQALVVMNRLRLRDYFQDHDKLRKGYCTKTQARSILSAHFGVNIPEADWLALVARYSRDDGMFCYEALCEVIDEAFTVKAIEKNPDREVNYPTATTTEPARRNRMDYSLEEQEELHQLEDDIRTKMRQTRKLIVPTFQDFDKTRRGHVTKAQFHRVMSMLGFELSSKQVELLSLKYCNLGNKNEFDWVEFVKSIDPSDIVDDGFRVAIIEENTYFNKRGRVIGSPEKNEIRVHPAAFAC
ncbi:unnamed protein product [Vitrella brassicaformis CCMP3155]|uniref:EF-hand domain-containing protein n=1 Tax=Vitrella brassicaformis (strain CCMP3155) TaxID=1169540 RepID=A0A0G4GP71_VITBC|nr:unnamed protein product [Vitrella brassicaformis CCMP3155]|eukprot:CEM32084.1 unnamed protein product [Vitrella brassicaformis CCMP3155]